MLLQIMNCYHAASFFDINSILICGARDLVDPIHLANLEDVIQSIESNLDDLIIH